MTSAEHFLNEILERITDGFIALDKNWCYTYVNKRAGEIFQRDPQEMIGKHIWTEFPEDIRQPHYMAYQQAMTEQKNIYLEEYYPSIDKWFEKYIYPSPEGLSVFFSCITDKKKAEEALKISEEKYRTLFERNLAGVYQTNLDGDILAFNDAFAKIMGYGSRNELLKENARALYFSNADRENFISRLREKGELINLEFTMKNKDGNPVYIIENCALRKNEVTGEEFIEGVMIDITERKKMEETLRKSEEQFRRVVEHIHDALMVDDIHGNVIYANDKFLQLFGFNDKDIGKIRLEDYVSPEFRQPLRERHEKRIRGQAAVSHFEYEGIRTDGQRLWLETDVTIIKGDDDSITGTQSAIRDITERKKAENDLRLSEEKYHSLIEHASDAIFVSDSALNIIEVNSLACQNLGYSREEMLTMKATDLLHFAPNDPPLQIHRLLAGETTVLRRNGKRKDGTLIPIELTARMMPDGRFLGIARDIRERIKSEDELRANEAKYRSVVENIHEALLIDDVAGNLVYANKEFSNIFGYTQNELKNLTLKDITAPESYAEIMKKHHDRINGIRVPAEYVYKGIRKDGTEIWMDARVSAITENGKIIGTQSLERDITERKKAEEQINESEEKFRTIVKNTSDGFVLYDMESKRVLETNSAYEKMLGYTGEEMKKLTLYDIVSHDKSSIDKYNDRISRKKFVAIGERKHRRKDGTIVNVDVTVNLLSISGREVMSVMVRDISERLEKDRQLKRSEENYRSLIEHASDGIFITDLNEHFLDANSSACELAGYSKDELLSMVVDDLVIIKPGDTPSRMDEIRSGIRIIQERNIRRKDGSMIPVEVTAKILPDKRILSIVRDVTERKKNEKKLAESENRLRTIIQTEPECIKLLGPNCELLEMNPAGLAMIEADNIEQVINHSVLDLIDEQHRDAYARLASDVFNGKSGTLEFEITGLKGTHRWLETHSVPMKNVDGKIISLLAITHDITERKKTEEKIRKSEEQYRDLVDNISDLICTHDLDGKILSVNSAAENLSGYTLHPDRDLNVKELLAADNDDEFNRYIDTIKKNGHAQGLMKVRTRSGEIRFWEYNNSLKTSAASTPVVRGYARDITESKKAKEEIVKMNEQLRNLAGHLQNIREEERKKIAREIHDELGQQLTVIKMNLHSLLKKNKIQDSEFTQKAAAISDYINQSIDTVRKISSELRPVILDDFGIADALQMHSKEFSSRTGIACEISVEGNEIVSDTNARTQIFRIYQEALTNVARHSKASKVSSTLKTEHGIIKILINDNGRGFNPEIIAEKKSLGLIMMRERAIGIGGTLEIKSAPGKGTSVIFSVPKEIQPV
jgi:PAS domain S-box-containing protein